MPFSLHKFGPNHFKIATIFTTVIITVHFHVYNNVYCNEYNNRSIKASATESWSRIILWLRIAHAITPPKNYSLNFWEV